MSKTVTAAAVALMLLAEGAAARAETVKVFVGGAMTGPVRLIAADFTARTGNVVDVVSDTTGGLQNRLRAGEKADVLVITAPGLDTLQKESLAVAAGRVDLALGLMGVGVKAGAPSPDLSTAEGFKASLLAARTVSYVDPKAGGTSGAHFEEVMKAMGIAEQMRSKTVYRKQGSEVAAAVAKGEADLGVTFTSELAPNPGVRVAGALPGAFQMPTTYDAALSTTAKPDGAAGAFLKALQTPAAMTAIRNAGMEPLVRSR
ncbi:MAG TPA: molybdate ABC transporter substrate-binding protein [Caulobacteraceae bacterium]|nr:molybdate ABC transporter substrate-binding protein [Caulobacteraceae bacterium]